MDRRQFLKVAGSAVLVGSAVPTRIATAHPGPFEPLGQVDIDGAKEAVLSPDGKTAYVAATSGYVTVDLSSPDRPQILAERRELRSDHEDGPFRNIYDVKLDGDTLLAVGPANPLPGSPAGVLVVDVSDPSNPVEGSFYETSYPIHNCFAAAGRAYLTANDGDENPIVVLDIETGAEIGRWSIVSEDERWADVPRSVRPVHDVWVRDSIAYVSMWDAGTWLVDLTDPSDPSVLSSIGAADPAELTSLSGDQQRRMGRTPPGNHHSAATNEPGDILGIGIESWANRVSRDDETTELVGGPSGVELWNISDPTNPELLSTIDPPESPNPTVGGVWTTAHNFDFHDGKLYSAWYRGGVKVHDIASPTDPVELSWWRDPERASFWTAQYAYPFADEGVFVASSWGVDDVSPALYTFPDHAGEQLDPPPLSSETTDESQTTTPTQSPTSTPTETSVSDEEGTQTETVSRTDVPGFGVGVGVAALGAAGWAVRRRARRE
ncbi:LVIVD repeat-containing protein [Haloferax sp. DFSO52]|uniref:LVIVD repeat-containing protein n=1 Tax=Haloferax sp. DFSO52 TaxID=3388505 RepID=UPI003A84646C